MLGSLGGIGRVLAQTWPALLAWYLGGELVRASVLALAAPLGSDSALAALLLVPIAVLARLVSYVGMFLVLRRALPAYRDLAEGQVTFTGWQDAAREFTTILLASIGPFFTLYALLGLVSKDLSDYARAAFRYSMSEKTILNVGDGPLVLAVVVIAFGGRMVIKYFGSKLPEWTGLVSVYLDATWVFVALTGLSALFGPAIEWIQNRQVVHWVEQSREFLRSLWSPIRAVIDGIDWLTPVAVQLVLLPLAWLLIAGVIYTRALGNAVEERREPGPVAALLRSRIQKLPRLLRSRARLYEEEWQGTASPLLLAGRMILGAGWIRLAVVVATYGLLYALSQWALRGLFFAVGPHEPRFWFTADDIVSLVASAVFEPVRVVLLAVVFDFCLGRYQDQRMRRTVSASAPIESAPAPDSR